MLLFAGVLHGSVSGLERLYEVAEQSDCKAIIQLGDFGIHWPEPTNMIHEFFESVKPKIPLYFCDGNHENHTLLDSLWRQRGCPDVVPIVPGCFHVRRGTELILDGRKILFMGGANTHKASTELQWWPREMPDHGERMRFIRALEEKPDIVASHDCPSGVGSDAAYYEEWSKNSSVAKFFHDALITTASRPTKWFFGHHHFLDSWDAYDTTFYCCGAHGESWTLKEENCVRHFLDSSV